MERLTLLKKIIFWIIFCFGFCYKGTSQLNDSIKTLEMTGVVITATKSEKPLVELTVPATIISKEEILSSGHSRLNEIINEQTGLVTVPSFGGGEGIQLQGIDSDYTLILLDGLPLIGRVAGNFDLSRITLGSVERIEIIKGASSSLYGSEALGGVVNIITNKNYKEGFQSNLSYKYGSFKTQDANTEIRYGKNNFSLSTNLNYYSSDGYDLVEGDNQKTVEAFNNFTGDINLNYNNNTLGLFNIKFRTFLEKRDGTVFITSPGLSAKSNTSENNVTIRHKKQITEKTSTFLDYYRTNFNNEESNILNNVLQNNTFDQTLERIDLRFEHLLNKASLTAGIGLNNEFLERTNILTKPKLKSQFIYFQHDWILNKTLNIVSGLRYDKHNEYKSQLSPKISFKIDLSNRFNIKGSVGSGYKAPDFRQLYLNFSNSSSGYIVLGANILEETIKSLQENEELLIYNEPENNKLNSESSNSYNLGIQYYVNSNFPLEINFFRNNINNLIEAQIVGRKTNGQTIFSYLNVNKSYTQGFEFSGLWTPKKNLDILLGYQLLFAKDKEVSNEFKDGLVYARDKETKQSFQLYPRHYFGLFGKSRNMVNMKLNYTINKIRDNLSFKIIYRGKYGLVDTNNNTYLDNYDDFIKGHFVVNLSFYKKLYSKLYLQVNFRNLLNYKDAENLVNNPGRRFSVRIIYKN